MTGSSPRQSTETLADGPAASSTVPLPGRSATPYKTAKHLAASRRRDGIDSYVVYDVGEGIWKAT